MCAEEFPGKKYEQDDLLSLKNVFGKLDFENRCRDLEEFFLVSIYYCTESKKKD